MDLMGKSAIISGLRPRSAPFLLLIEDSADDRMLAVRALAEGDLSLRVQTAEDGSDAIRQIADMDENGYPRMVLLDLNLPDVHGLDVLSSLRQDPALAHVPIIVFSSSDESEEVEESYLRGANSFVKKPSSGEHFAHVIRTTARYWLHTNLGRPDYN